jgi:malonate transporter and related proteins
MPTILLNALVPVFAVLALGYLAGWVRDIDNHHLAELNALVMDFALPAALFVATASTPWAVLKAQWPLLLVLTTTTLLLYALAYWIQRRVLSTGPDVASIGALTISQPNFAAAGLPLIAAVFDASHLIYVALSVAFTSIFVSPFALAVLETARSPRSDSSRPTAIVMAVGRSVLKPIVLSPIAGIVFAFAAIPLPDFIQRSLELIGNAGGGIALFLTGLILSSQRVTFNSNVISGTLLKNVVHPLLAGGAIMLFHVPSDTVRASILLAALPSGFFGVLFGLRYNVDSRDAGSILIVSSTLSALTIAVVLAITEHS